MCHSSFTTRKSIGEKELPLVTSIQMSSSLCALRPTALSFPYFCSHHHTRRRLSVISKGVKFTDDGTVSISCGVDKRRQTFTIEVEDTGIGLSEAALSRLFQPFTQADSSITRRYGGTGLGLVISQRLVQRMHGTLSVASGGEGRGCRFTVRLPWFCPEAPADLQASMDLFPEKLPLEGWDPRVVVVDELEARGQATCELLQVTIALPALAPASYSTLPLHLTTDKKQTYVR